MATLRNECSLPESIRCYLLRGNAMVPLVPADQLPFQLKGIPRQLNHRQMSDEGWKLFKETREAPLLLSIQTPPTNDSPSHYSPGKPQYLAPDYHVRTESQTARMVLDRAGPSLATVESAPESHDAPFAVAVERLFPLTDAVASIYPNDALRLGYTSSTIPDMPRKVYCTHWIATGECRWTLTGCKYKHEMPGTEKLRELGFTRGTPKWWKDKNAISPPKKMTWMQRRLARVNDEEPQTRDMPFPRAFPDPSTLRARRLEEHSDDLSIETQKNSPQTPNLIDLEDMTIPPGSSPRSLISSAKSSTSCSPPAPCSEISHSPILSSSPLPSYFPPLPTPKTKTAKPHRVRKHLPPHNSSPLPPSSSSTPSSSSSSPESSDTDTSAPRIRHRIRKPQRKTLAHRKTISTNAAASTAPRLVKSAKNAEPVQLGLANSKYAVQTVVSSKIREDKDVQAEYIARKAHRKERRGERSM